MNDWQAEMNEWHRQQEIVLDETLPKIDRLKALHWIDNHVGIEPTPENEFESAVEELKIDRFEQFRNNN